MNYIYFNPREWSFGQSGQVERCFINDFDNSLIEGMLLGGWNIGFAKATSKHYLLAQDTEYCFVFWLNGGENDKGSGEICQLQISFSQNQDDCYIYKLNRNYIRPLLHSQGWELYSIPFRTPDMSDALADSIPNNVGTVFAVDAQFAFVAGFAPMAVKPAKEPDFYKDWKDEPDEFAEWRPQRHNIVFEDGWPSINAYGGDKYSTEVLRARKDAEIKGKKNWNFGGLKNKDARMHMERAPYFVNFNKAYRAPNQMDADELSECVEECADRTEEARERYTELEDRFDEAQERYNEFSQGSLVTAERKALLDGRFAAMTTELSQISEWLNEAEAIAGTALHGNLQELPFSGGLYAWEGWLDAMEGRFDAMESSLDSLEDFLDTMEDESEDEEDYYEEDDDYYEEEEDESEDEDDSNEED